jgi:predicted transport protein
LRLLVEVASPVVLRLYDCYDRAKTLSLDAFAEAVELLESYVFRRSVCDMQTRNLGQIFASLAYRIKDDAPLLNLKVALHRQGKKRRFPTDAEFREGLETRDVYDMRHCHYLLDRLENDSKEKIETSSFTIEHIMPQNEALCAEWQTMLGSDWKTVQEVWLHRLGNITLTGYNSEYSDLPFEKKKTLVDKEGKQVGFNFSPLRLNKYVREQQTWTESEMEKRGKEWAARGVAIWPALLVDMVAVKAAELEERKAQAAKYSLDKLEFDPESKALFDALRPQILALGDDVIELCGPKSVTYRVYDFFVEVMPRKRRLLLIVNLDFAECDDPSGIASDATEWAFITNASEEGGTLFTLEAPAHINEAVHVIRQGYQSVAE